MKKYIIAMLLAVSVSVNAGVTDGGAWDITVTPTGMTYSTTCSGFGSDVLTIVNCGSGAVYASVNNTHTATVAAVTAGYGAVPIKGGASHTWEAYNIRSVGIASTNATETINLQFYKR